jgi:hypothetical protein
MSKTNFKTAVSKFNISDYCYGTEVVKFGKWLSSLPLSLTEYTVLLIQFCLKLSVSEYRKLRFHMLLVMWFTMYARAICCAELNSLYHKEKYFWLLNIIDID